MILVIFTNENTALAEWLSQLLSDSRVKTSVQLVPVESEALFLKTIELHEAELKSGGTVLPIFFDGTSEESKTILLSLKACCAAFTSVQLQALNAKKGGHTLYGNAEAILSSILKRLPTAAAPPAPAPVETTDFGSISADALLHAVSLNQGEVLWPIALPSEQFEVTVQLLLSEASKAGLATFPAAPPVPQDGLIAQEFMIRRAGGHRIELRLAVCGNVDSGKSTLTSVLTHGQKDDGRGSARSKVFVHQHEADTGRTSCISENHMGFDAVGGVVNYAQQSAKHGMCTAAVAEQSAKICTLYDLAGHEKYLKTTVLGMTRNVPDYGCIVISANNGIQRMTKEHLGLCLALRLPFFVVVTRIDATPANVHAATMDTILKLLKAPTVKKLPFHVKSDSDVVIASKHLKQDRIAPIFEVSNVTGQGLEHLVRFINILPVRNDWSEKLQAPKEMIIDSTFFVTGVGTVVGGIVTQGVFRPNDTVLLGPDGLGNYRPVQIKSIHSKGIEVSEVECGNDAALCLKKEKRAAIRKGNVLVDPLSHPMAYWQFEAEIRILYHSTTISNNYEPVIHSPTVRQSARIISIDREVLRTGDHAVVRFHFLYRPEHMKLNQRIIFREGRTKGIGTIVNLFTERAEGCVMVSREAVKQSVRERHERK